MLKDKLLRGTDQYLDSEFEPRSAGHGDVVILVKICKVKEKSYFNSLASSI